MWWQSNYKKVNENINIENYFYPFLAMVGTLLVFFISKWIFSLTGKEKTKKFTFVLSVTTQKLWPRFFLKTQWPNTCNSTKWSQLDGKIICKLCSKGLTWIPVDLLVVDVHGCLRSLLSVLQYLSQGLKLHLSWLPVPLKIVYWQPEFYAQSPAGN